MSIKNTKNTRTMNKHLKRAHRARKGREHIKKLGIETGVARLTLFRSNQHIYAQILSPIGGKVLACASSLDKEIKGQTSGAASEGESGKIGLSKRVGQLIAERAKAAGIASVACDRSGFKYHGRIAALVNAAREHGLTV